jgi:hypothetical protein
MSAFHPLRTLAAIVAEARPQLQPMRVLGAHASAIDDLCDAKEEEKQAHQSGKERGGNGKPEP